MKKLVIGYKNITRNGHKNLYLISKPILIKLLIKKTIKQYNNLNNNATRCNKE